MVGSSQGLIKALPAITPSQQVVINPPRLRAVRPIDAMLTVRGAYSTVVPLVHSKQSTCPPHGSTACCKPVTAEEDLPDTDEIEGMERDVTGTYANMNDS